MENVESNGRPGLIAKEQHQAGGEYFPRYPFPLFPRLHYDYFNDFLPSLVAVKVTRGAIGIGADCPFRPRLGATAFAECVIMERPVMAQSGPSTSATRQQLKNRAARSQSDRFL